MIKSVRSASWTVALMLAALTTSTEASTLQSIEDVESISSHRMKALFRVGGDPPLQFVEAEGEYTRVPDCMKIAITQGEGTGEPITIEIRQVDGQLYHRMRTMWGEIEKYDLAELMLLTPEQLHGIEGNLEEAGEEELEGRKVLHLRGHKDDLPVVGAGHDTIDFSRMERADLDLWIDVEERFITKIHIRGEAKQRGEILDIDMLYQVHDFNEKIQIERPPEDEIVRTPRPVSKTQHDVNDKLGFNFTLPAEAFVTIYGSTVNVITRLPLDDAREFAATGMRAAGFTAKEEIARPTGEYYADYEKDGRILGVQVFQVSDKGATIQLGAMK